MSRITDYILEPKVVYTDGGFLVRVKVIDDYKYKKYIVSENLHYKTVQGTSFTLTDADSTKQASILELQGDTTQNGTPTPSSPIEVQNVTGDNNVVVSNKNLFNGEIRQGNQNYTTTQARLFSNKNDWYVTSGTILTFSTNLPDTFKICFYLAKNPYLSGTYTAMQNFSYFTNGQTTITLTANGYLGFTIAKVSEANITPSEVEGYNFQIEKGNQATTYIQHEGNNYRIDLGGKNLFDVELATSRAENRGGSLVNGWGGYEDGIVTNNKSMGYFGLCCFAGQKFTLKPNESYTLSATVYLSGTNATSKCLIGFVDVKEETKTIIKEVWTDINVTFTNNSEEKTDVRTVIEASNTGNIVQIKNIQLEKNSVPTAYSPYVANPIELCKIGEYQDKIKLSTGKNLFEGFSFTKTNSGITFTYNTDGSIKVNGTASANSTSMYSSEATSYLFTLESGTYTLSGVGLTANIRAEIVKSNGTLLAQTDSNLYKSFTINEDTNVFLRVYIASGTTVNNLFIYPMLNKGSTALPYEPYGTGKWYVSKYIGKVEIKQNSYISVQEIISGANKFIWRYASALNVAGSGNRDTLLCNYFIGDTGIWGNNNKIGAYINGSNQTNFSMLCSTVGGTTSNTKAELLSMLETWLNNNKLIMYYPLATPTYTEITDNYLLEQLNGLLDIELYEDLCYVDWIGIQKPTMSLLYSGTEDLGIKYIITEDGKKIRTDWRKLGRRKNGR